MRYELNLAGRDWGTGGGAVFTEFECEESYLDRVAGNYRCETFDEFVHELAEEISGEFYLGFVNHWDAVEAGELPEDSLEDERGFFEYEDGDIRVAVNHTHWGMSETIALTTGEVVVRNMLPTLAVYWCKRHRKMDGFTKLVKNWVRKRFPRLAKAA